MPDEAISAPSGLTTEGLLGRRYLARFIDTFVIVLLLGLVATVLQRLLLGSDESSANSVWLAVTLLGGWIGYGAVLESSPWQATLGKRMVNLRVYNAVGGRLTLLQAAGRAVVKDGPFLALSFVPGGRLLAFLWLGAHLVVLYRSPVYQAIHDRALGTLVAAPEATLQLKLS